MQETRISQTDSDRDSTTVSYSLEEDRLKELEDSDTPQPEEPPPSYEESINVDEHQGLPQMKEMDTSLMEDGDEDEGVSIDQSPPPPSQDSPAVPTDVHRNVEFPLTHYYELEGRVHTDQWSIPYKKEESLGVCMLSTIEMMREGKISVIMYMYMYQDAIMLVHVHLLPTASNPSAH